MIQVQFLPTLPSLLSAPHTPLIHRDLSWLQFNERVLAEARQASNPLLERVKFLAISASNLDEFFMVRYGSLEREIVAAGRKKKGTSGPRQDAKTFKHLLKIRATVLESVAKFNAKQMEALDMLAPELEMAGIRLVRGALPGDAGFEIGRAMFADQILPKLTPPEKFTFGKLSSLETVQVGVLTQGGIWFKIPKSLPQVLSVAWPPPLPASGGESPFAALASLPGLENAKIFFFTLDDLLLAHLPAAFRLPPKPGIVRVTRDGDFTVDLEEEDSESIPDVVRSGLGSREKGRPFRLQYAGNLPGAFLNQASATLKLVPGQILPAPHTLCLHGLWSIVSQTPADALDASSPVKLRYPPLQLKIPIQFRDPTQIFERLKERDFLLHHPYDSFDSYVAWIQAACNDPAVEVIEQTVYRMDALSPVIDALKRAAAAGKLVKVVIELRARFDELNNLKLADELRKAGVEVAFGFGKLKLHAKVALVVRNEGGEKRRYTHLSTGNYNAATARQYTDLAILTANPEIGLDAQTFFDTVVKGQIPQQFKKLVSAPMRLHRLLLSHIHAETQAASEGKKARIVAKVNALVDAAVVESLYRASRAGVQVDLIVRGACSLIPGVQGLSENIRVISVVDRFLEHSRIYYFENSKTMYLSSADWMPRNFFSRLEIAFPVLDPRIYSYIEQVVIPTYLKDTVKARELTLHGTWKRRTGYSARGGSVRSQFVFEQLALNDYEGTPLHS